MFNFGPSCVLLTAMRFGLVKQSLCTRPLVCSRVTTVVIEHMVSLRGFAGHLCAQVLICCACDVHIQKSNEAGLFDFMCKLYGRYDAVDVGLEPVKAVSFDDCERVIHIAEPKFGNVLTLSCLLLEMLHYWLCDQA